MIKFFRKIRQNLVMENKTSKYFKYAIGEIVLVIIGILIALQINNWNEKRKVVTKTNNYLKALNIELETNIESIDVYMKITLRDIKESAKTHRLLNTPEAKTYNDSVLRYSMTTKPIYKATLAKSTFDDLINSGVLENLNELKLKRDILSIIPNIEMILESYNNAKDTWDKYQLPYLMKYANVSNNWDSLSGVRIEKLPFKRKRAAFINNGDYASILALRMRMLDNYRESLKETKEKFISISTNIKHYLKEN